MDLARQPLFRLLAAVIVLLITDMNPLYGVVALVVWILWVSMSFTEYFRSRR